MCFPCLMNYFNITQAKLNKMKNTEPRYLVCFTVFFLALLNFLSGCKGDEDSERNIGAVEPENHDQVQPEKKSKDPFEGVLHMGQGAILNETELAELTALAESGNGKAAFRLSVHYGMGVGNAEMALKYEQLAFDLNYPPAVYDKAISLWNKYTNRFYKGPPIDKEEIRALIIRAENLEYPDEYKILEKLDKFEPHSVKSSADNE